MACSKSKKMFCAKVRYNRAQELGIMAVSIEAQTVPIELDAHGVMRIAGTRVTLDTVVAAFEQGATAEEIAQQYPSLDLADVYSVISFYLRRRSEIIEYLAQRQRQAQTVQKQNERRFDPHGVRDRLIARRPK